MGFAVADGLACSSLCECGSAAGLIACSVNGCLLVLITVVDIPFSVFDQCNAVVWCCRLRRRVRLMAVLLCHQQHTSGTVWGCRET